MRNVQPWDKEGADKSQAQHAGGAGGLTESGSLMVTCSEKRTFGGLVRSWAFLAALMKADLGD